jgi:hypothetical protein
MRSESRQTPAGSRHEDLMTPTGSNPAFSYERTAARLSTAGSTSDLRRLDDLAQPYRVRFFERAQRDELSLQHAGRLAGAGVPLETRAGL